MVAVPSPHVHARRRGQEAEVAGHDALAALPDAGRELVERAPAVGAGAGFGFEPLVRGVSTDARGEGAGLGKTDRLKALDGVEGVAATFDADDVFVMVEPFLADRAFWDGD